MVSVLGKLCRAIAEWIICAVVFNKKLIRDPKNRHRAKTDQRIVQRGLEEMIGCNTKSLQESLPSFLLDQLVRARNSS